MLTCRECKYSYYKRPPFETLYCCYTQESGRLFDHKACKHFIKTKYTVIASKEGQGLIKDFPSLSLAVLWAQVYLSSWGRVSFMQGQRILWTQGLKKLPLSFDDR